MAKGNSIDGGADQLSSTPLFDAVSALELALIEPSTLGKAFDAAGDGSNPAPWVHVYQAQIAALDAHFSKVYDAAFAVSWGKVSP